MLAIQSATLTSVAVGGTIALAASLACIHWVAPFGWVDHPDHRKHHHAPTARTAGLALWLLILGLLFAGKCPLPLNRVEWAGVHAMALIGLLDDRFNLRSRHKALVGLGVALMLAVNMASKLSPVAMGIPFLGMLLPAHPLLTVPLLLLWFWSIPQAMNLIDGLNGLSIGFSILLLSVLAFVMGYAPAGGYLSGALLAVLLLNYPKARHFLGDCGSLMLGTLFALLAAKAFVTTDANLMLWLFAYPIADVTLVVAVRQWKGMPLGAADRSHLHHYLVDQLGMGRAWLVPLILLSLAFLPMTRAMGFRGHELISLLGVAGLLLLGGRAFRDRVDPARRAVPLHSRKELEESSGPNQVA